MDTVKLIAEQVEDVEFITEDNDEGKKNYKIRGVFMQADVKNRNGRIYPMEVLQNRVQSIIRNLLKKNEPLENWDIQRARQLILKESPI